MVDYDEVFRQTGVAQAVVSPDGLIVAANDEMCALFGRRRDDLLGTSILSPEQSTMEDQVRLHKVLSGELPLARFERRSPHHWGGPIDLLVTLTAVARGAAIVAAAVCVQDITEQKSAQRRAERAEGRWRSLSQNASDVALVTDADLRISYASPAMTALLGHGTADTVGTSLELLIHPDDAPRVRAALRALVEEQGHEAALEHRVRNSAGEWRYVEQHVLNLLGDPHVGGLVVNLRDRTELHELRVARRRAVLEDRLTGLANRALIMDRVQQAIERRHGGGGQYALLFVDLDRLRVINDTYGQVAGDEVLRRVSDTLCALVGPADTVGRYAGDEFVVLLDEAQDPRIVERIAARVSAGLSMDISVDAHTTVRVSACVGVALGPATSAEALISAAETATYRAKSLGRGRVHVLEEGYRDAVADQRRLGIELAAAVADEQLAVHYQPIVELRSGNVVSFEALVRWPHPQRGMLGPDAFLPLAETLDLQQALDEWVLRSACATACEWPASVSVAVNVSPQHLLSPGYAEMVEGAVSCAGLAPERLVLEITETAVVADVAAAQAVLAGLRAFGVRFSIDDFGTGYSSMLQLRQLPFTTLKVDREFVSGLPSSEDDRAICASVVSLARKLGVRTVAEGVEREEQAVQLASLGCQLGQGYLWSPAVDADEVQRLLAASPWEPVPFVRPVRQTVRPETEDPAVVQQARTMHEAGASLHTIAAGLNAKDTRTRAGRRWSPATVARLLDPLPTDHLD